MKNKDLIEKRLEGTGYAIGCYDKDIEKLTKKELSKVLDCLLSCWTDVKVMIKNKEYYVEIETINKEIDLHVLSIEEYENRYGKVHDED